MSIAVVTGASGGIGAEIAKRLAQDGFSVALIYNRNAEKAQKTADEITLSGGSAKTYKCDVRDSSEITSAIEAIERDFGEISVLVNKHKSKRCFLLLPCRTPLFCSQKIG